jgi:hypothetical protein
LLVAMMEGLWSDHIVTSCLYRHAMISVINNIFGLFSCKELTRTLHNGIYQKFTTNNPCECTGFFTHQSIDV